MTTPSTESKVDDALEKKELYQQLHEKQRDINTLRNRLNELDEQKEAAFETRERYAHDISKHISAIKSSKTKRDALTTDVKSAKQQRDELQKKSKEKQEELKKLTEEKRLLLKKYRITENPSQIRHDIKRIEYRIETDVMPFDKEEKLNKIVKDLKKKLKECSIVEEVSQKIAAMQKEVRDLHTATEQLHQKVVSTAATSQEKHETLIGEAKEADAIREKGREADEKFSTLKQEFKKVNDELKAKLIELNDINKRLGISREQDRKEREEKEEKKLRSMEEIVHGKMKKGEKLTTEDLLIMQHLMKKEEGMKR